MESLGKAKRVKIFERHPTVSLIVIVGTVLLIGVITLELFLRLFMGLGNPILYESYPLYGYRLLPDQEVSRFNGSTIKVNNLGLRANEDWDQHVDDKILFLGDSVTYGGTYISNSELFSTLAVRDIPGYRSGNAGINAWGVENIHGLIVGAEFLPARVYVTVLLETDFYRGVTGLPALWVWSVKPAWAIHELLQFFYYQQGQKRFVSWKENANEKKKSRVAQNAMSKLKEMDRFLKSRDYVHEIYITPTRKQVLGVEGKDSVVLNYLEASDLKFTYLLDRINSLGLSEDEKKALFHDKFHLEEYGHVLWGELIHGDLRKVLS